VVLLLSLIGFYLTCYVLYHYVLIFCHFLLKDTNQAPPSGTTRFGILVPAHNEEILLSRLLRSIDEQNYQRGKYHCIVVADNCTDNTANIGLRHSATVLTRKDPVHRGKGYALQWGLSQINLNDYDAIFVVDADSEISREALAQLDRLLNQGESMIQCYNGVANPDDSWFSRLLDVSRSFVNEICLPAKQKLGLSVYLMGNGMCFSTRILSRYGWSAFTVGEDWEYYARLIQDGEKVGFGRMARVYHQESVSLGQATSQRMRWSSGRFFVAGKYGFLLFLEGIREGNFMKLDASLPLLFPNLSLGMNLTVFSFVLAFAALHEGLPRSILLALLGTLTFMQLMMFLSGILFTNNKLMKALSIFLAPLFLFWKLGIDLVSLAGFGRGEWTRTERKHPGSLRR